MKAFSFVLLIALLIVFVSGRPEEKYTTKYDNIDLDEIIKSDRLMKNYVNCLMERGGCSPDGAELKRVLPDALQTECSKCSQKQKDGSNKILRHLYNNRREWWNELEAKYDKDGDYVKKHKEELN